MRGPDRIHVWFSERPDPGKSDLVLLRGDGSVVTSGARATSDPTELSLPVAALDDGTYTVAWHTVSAEDGDAASGYFAFAVGKDASAALSKHNALLTNGDVQVILEITPGRVGENGYAVRVTRGGEPLPNVTRVRLYFEPLIRPDLGSLASDLAGSGATFVGTGMELALAGRFGVTVEVRRRDILDDLRFPFEITVPVPAPPPASASPSPAAAPSSTPPAAKPDATPAAVIALLVVVAGLGILALRRPR